MDTIELLNINLTFNNKTVLKNFSLRVNPGDKILISGSSGKGKSTILKLLLGFEDSYSGDYLINNKEKDEYSFYEIRKKFAYVDQDISLRKIRGQQYLEEISKYSGNNLKGKLDKQLCEYFEFDLALLEKDIQKFSGGERQRLALIIAIMLGRPIFLLDEVTSALDANLKNKVVKYFRECEQSVISISHDDIWMEDDKFKKVVL